MRKQGKFAAYMWNHAGIVIRPKGMAGKMHIEIRGKTAVILMSSYPVVFGLAVYGIVQLIG